MTLTTPATSPGTDSTPTITLNDVVNGETSRIYTDSGCTQLYGTAVAAGTSVAITTDPLAPGIVTFYTRSTNVAGTGPCSAGLLTYEYLGIAPVTATTLTLFNPTTSPNYDGTPTFLASGGITNGDTVNLYTDAGCTIASGSILSTSTSAQVTSTMLVAGSHTFYTNTTNVIGTSACSSGMVTYNYAGPAPLVEIAWSANHEQAVNSTGGGYRIYYRKTTGVNVTTDSFIDVPYVSGGLAPTTKILSDLLKGTTFFKVLAYSSLNAPGTSSGSVSSPTSEFSVTLP